MLLAFLWVGLGRDPREVPSPLIGKPAPAFRLAQLHAPGESLSNRDLKGKVWLLNVWASWCVSCRVEHPLLVQLADQKIVPVVGLDYKDQPADASRLAHAARQSVHDVDRRPRRPRRYRLRRLRRPRDFLIDKTGVIRYKQIGPMTAEALQQKILPLVRELQK